MALLDWRFAIAVLVFGAPTIAAAADLPVAPSAPPTAPAAYAPPVPDWIVTIGLEARAVPAFPGASDNKLVPAGFPLFSIRKAGTPPDYFGPRDSFGFTVLDFGVLKFGPAFKLIGEREGWSYPELYGLAGVHYALQAGGFAEYWPVPWLRLRGELRQGFGGETGVTGDLFLDAVVPAGQFRFSAGPRMTIQSAAANSPYFSITTAEAAATAALGPSHGQAPLMAYNAGGGVYSYGAGGQIEYFLSPQWSTHVLAEYERLTGSVADSPLVTVRGSPDQFTFGIGATYSFNMHPLW
jgi:outer membrane protein